MRTFNRALSKAPIRIVAPLIGWLKKFWEVGSGKWKNLIGWLLGSGFWEVESGFWKWELNFRKVIAKWILDSRKYFLVPGPLTIRSCDCNH